MYKVITGFHDLQDCKETKAGAIPHWYEPGDIYPRNGATTTDARTKELASPHNAQGVPLIEFVEGEAPKEEVTVPDKKPAAKKTTRK
ncbi:hypothetical protein [Baileyella intestinalis]|uniref:hypothetical protein n=1 Tax=Baileyella intestinalis TaxID=2606709 RepID=UPI003A8A2130